jgi:hypothetical protein
MYCIVCAAALHGERSTRKYCSDACRFKAYRRRKRPPVSTVLHGNNADIMREVSRLYIRDGARVADVTYGKGIFWKRTDTSRFTLLGSDLTTVPERPYDFRATPYESASFDHVVFDPPYVHNPGKPLYEVSYRNAEHHCGQSHADIIEDYRQGMIEARRILRPRGLLWVKCKDEVQSGKQQWSHQEIQGISRELGMVQKDLFIVIPTSRMPRQHKRQIHAAKHHSYLLLFSREQTVR